MFWEFEWGLPCRIEEIKTDTVDPFLKGIIIYKLQRYSLYRKINGSFQSKSAQVPVDIFQ